MPRCTAILQNSLALEGNSAYLGLILTSPYVNSCPVVLRSYQRNDSRSTSTAARKVQYLEGRIPKREFDSRKRSTFCK
ncbi:hypothetical protein M422DRAFT_39199 [Sphaerobolus stellatus SS14]|uniref:Uncharacterized protein n=1 Tax=Sphaerobolus stellatus (strain SS14) TaxID=990650 RepID=A0A0C9TR91_SPHS4|nr:hypothetical protein M422DRAFT_39199 [Sphaerobolus stellatus SS14]